MQEGRPRESLVLFDTPIEVSSITFYGTQISTSSHFNRSDPVLIQMIPTENSLEVSFVEVRRKRLLGL